jgi:ubiquinone biosynthesis protein
LLLWKEWLKNLIRSLVFPELSIIEVAEPIARKLMYKTLSPEKLRKELLSGVVDYGNLIREFPIFMLNFLRKMEDDEFAMQFRLKDIEHIEKCINRIFNRVSFSIVLVAVSIIIAGIIVGSGMSAHTGIEIYFLNLTVLRIGLIIAAIIIIGLV